MKVQVQVSDAQLRQIDAENAVHLSMMSLNNIIGLPIATELDVQSRPENVRRDSTVERFD